MKKLSLTIILLSFFNISFSQKEFSLELGQITKEELKLTVYEKDSTANSVVLKDYGNTYVDEDEGYDFRTDYYCKLKFFNKDDIEKATFKFRLYKNQKLIKIKAITYTLSGELIQKTFLLDSQIFTKQISENLKEVSFTMPNIKPGCVIEYMYSFINPYSDIKDWYFQTDIPVIDSEFRVALPGNWRFNARLIGYEKLDKSDVSIKKECLKVPGIIKAADCAIVEYGMKNIPAFKEEDYMLSNKNFMSRFDFEIISYTDTRGQVTNYTKTWDDADRSLKKWFFDNQTSKKTFFKKQIPITIQSSSNPLEKAKKAFYFIQNRMSWDDYYLSSKVRVKNAYEEREGNVAEINLILHNFLQLLDIDSKMVVLSTRDNCLPTKLHPSYDVFNYAIVKVVIDGETYFLDATEKLLPFGEVPLRCLNGEGRVLDFKEGSYWEAIKPRFETKERSQFQLEFDESNVLKGLLTSSYSGYFSLRKKNVLKSKNKEERLEDFESRYPNIETNEISITGLENNESSLRVKCDFKMDVDEVKGRVTINPFLFNHKKENPFKLSERLYPVDFAHTRYETLLFSFNIPTGYKVKSFPESVGFLLPNEGGKYLLRVNRTDSKISFRMRFVISKKVFSSEEYYYLKEFYKKIIDSQKTFIVLEKI